MAHRDCSILIERANMYWQGIACTGSLEMGLASAEGKKLECFERRKNNFLMKFGFTMKLTHLSTVQF
jgi:hypothetical protein